MHLKTLLLHLFGRKLQVGDKHYQVAKDGVLRDVPEDHAIELLRQADGAWAPHSDSDKDAAPEALFEDLEGAGDKPAEPVVDGDKPPLAMPPAPSNVVSPRAAKGISEQPPFPARMNEATEDAGKDDEAKVDDVKVDDEACAVATPSDDSPVVGAPDAQAPQAPAGVDGAAVDPGVDPAVDAPQPGPLFGQDAPQAEPQGAEAAPSAASSDVVGKGALSGFAGDAPLAQDQAQPPEFAEGAPAQDADKPAEFAEGAPEPAVAEADEAEASAPDDAEPTKTSRRKRR